MHGANQKRFVPVPNLASIQKAANSAGFDKKVTFANLGLAGVTKFYKYKDYGEPKGQLFSKCPKLPTSFESYFTGFASSFPVVRLC